MAAYLKPEIRQRGGSFEVWKASQPFTGVSIMPN
jgi:hypothetical protein